MEKKPQMLAKEAKVNEIKGRFEAHSATVLVDYRGLTVAEDTELRVKLRNAGVDYAVEKNNLIKRAANALEIDSLDQCLEGPTAIAFANDPVELAKILADFAKVHKNLEFKGGLLDNNFLSAADVGQLAKVLPREQLIAKLMGSMQSPMYGFASCSQGLLRKFVYALDQIRMQKEA